MKNNTPSKINNPQYLRVLIVEDSEDDALLIIRDLKKGGYDPVYERVETAAAMKKALQEKQWNIILCDYKLPKFNAPSAILILKEANIDIPLIIVSGTIGEDVGIECMRLGAHDYIIKDNLSRLCPAIARELEEAGVRNKQRKAESQRKVALEALRKSEQSFRDVAENAYDGLIIVLRTGAHIYANKRASEITGYSVEELLKMRMKELAHPDEIPKLSEILKKRMAGEKALKRYETYLVHKEGKKVPIEVTGAKTFWHGHIADIVIFRDITERKQAEESLRVSERKFKELFERMSSGVAVYEAVDGGEDFMFRNFNSAGEKIENLNRKDIIGKRVTEVFPGVKEFGLFGVLQMTWKTGESEYLPDSLYKDQYDKGTWRESWVYKLPSGEIVAVYNDITDRKRAEEALRESEARLNVLYQESPIPTFTWQKRENDFILVNFNHAALLITDGKVDKFLGKRAEELYQNTPIIIENMRRCFTEHSVIRQDIVSKHFAPGKSLSVHYAFIPPDLIIVHTEDQTVRKRAEDVLRQSEERYRSILETIQEGYFEVDLAGNFTFFNDSICRILGYSKEEVIGMNNRQYTDKDNSKKLFQVFNEVYNSGEPTEGFDWQILRKDGTKKYVEASVSLQKDSSDKPIGFKGIVRDVTERKWAEEAQRLSEENFRRSLKDLPLGVRIVTMEGETVYANQAILDIYSYASMEELKTTPVEKRYTSKSYAEYQIRRKKRKGGDDAPYEYYIDILRKNGEVRHLHVFRKDILWNGERQFQVLYSDITERKWAEEALLESEEKLKMALTGAEMGMWDLNLTTMSGAVDERAAQILGYQKDNIPPQSHFWDEMTHPDDVPRIKEMIKAHLEGRTPVFKTEHRMRTATGEWKWVHGRGKITKRHIDGSPIQISGTIHDITDRKQAEERINSSLREKEILLREVHHRVKNNMQVISGLLDLPAALSGNQERRRMFHESQSRIHAMSLVHEKLYGSNNLARIDLADYVRTMSQDLFQTYKINPGKIDLIIQTDGDVYVDINKAIPCGLILNELISNALKHAFPGDRHGELQIIIRGMKKTEIEIVVRDNGLGLPDDVDIKQPESVGLHLVNGLVKNQLDGKMEVRQDAGTEILIKFPL